MKLLENVLTKENKVRSVESQANSQENESLLLFSRLHNPVIKNQMLTLMETAEQSDVQIPKTKPVYDEFGNLVIGPNGKLITEKIKNEDIPRTIVDLENQYNWILAQIEKDTPISLDKGFSACATSDGLGREEIKINFLRTSGEKVTTKQQSMFEAHEKGHAIRRYYENGSVYLKNYFLEAIDISKIDITKEDLELKKQLMLLNVPESEIDEIKNTEPNITDYKESTIEYLTRPYEIAERMSQLKNYFGFKGTEKFTIEHLQYAKKHYIEDIGFDNEMKLFFQAIPKEKEGKFCEIMNVSGI